MSRFQLETAGVLRPRPPDSKRNKRPRPRPITPNSNNVPVLERRKMFEQTDSALEKPGKRRLTISGRKGDISRSGSFRGSKKIRIEDAGSPVPRGRQLNAAALWHKLKNFGHYDLQSMTVDRLFTEKVEAGGAAPHQASGASAAQVLASRVAASDPVSNELVASCPSFRNEIGGDSECSEAGSSVMSLRGSLSHEKQKRVGTREKMVLDGELPVKELIQSRGAMSRQASSVFEPYSGVHFPFEYIDYGATYYRNYFMGQEHQNFFGIDENIGPVAISLKRERVPEELTGFYDFIPSAGPLHMPTPKHQYRVIVRMSELNTLRGTVLEEAIPSGTKAGTSRGLPPRDVVDYICQGELLLSCLRLSKQDKVQQELARLDEQELNSKYKIGVLFVKKDQSSEEEFYNNEFGSKAFNEFLELLGQKVKMRGFAKYRAQLDNKTDTTGEFSVYTEFRDAEIMFHVSTLLPYTPSNKQQLLRKRHIGNDIVTVIFQESGCQAFSPACIRSHFQHIFVVVRAEVASSGTTKYSVAVSRSNDIPYFGPPIPEKALFDKGEQFRDFILTKLVNACNASLRNTKFSAMAIRTRKQYLVDLAEGSVSGLTIDQANNTGIVGFLSKNWGGRKRERTRLPCPLVYTPGALTWNVSLILREGKPLPFSEEHDFHIDCVLGMSPDLLIFIDSLTKETLLHVPARDVTGWLQEGTRLNIFYDHSSCLSLESLEGEEDVCDIATRMQALAANITPSHEATLMDFQRASNGLLGFSINEAGVVKKVDGLAKSIGLQKDSCILQVEDRLLCAHTHTQITELLTDRRRVTVRAFVVPPSPAAARSLLYYPPLNWPAIYAFRPSHGDQEESSSEEPSTHSAPASVSQLPMGGSVRLRRPHPPSHGGRHSYVEGGGNADVQRAKSQSPADMLYDDDEPVYDRLLNFETRKGVTVRVPRASSRGHGREDKGGFTRVKRTNRATRESVVNFADDLMERNMGQGMLPPDWEPEPMEHTVDIYSPQVKAQVATSVNLRDNRPHTAAPLSTIKHRRVSPSDTGAYPAVSVSSGSPVPHTPGQVQELAKRFSFPVSPTTPTGAGKSVSKIPGPSGQKTPMKATGSAAGMMKTGIPLPKSLTESPVLNEDSAILVRLRDSASKSGRKRPMSWDSSLFFNAEKLSADVSKDDSVSSTGVDQSFDRNSHIRHGIRKKSQSREFSPEPEDQQLTVPGLGDEGSPSGLQLTSQQVKLIKDRISVKERTRRWEQRGGGVPSYFTLPRPPKKQRRQKSTDRSNVRQSSVPPADTSEDGEDSLRGQRPVSGIPPPGSISKIPSSARASPMRRVEPDTPPQMSSRDEADGASNADEPTGGAVNEMQTADSAGGGKKSRSLSVALDGSTILPNHPPIIRSRGLSLTVGRARGQHLLPTKTQIPSSSGLAGHFRSAQPVAPSTADQPSKDTSNDPEAPTKVKSSSIPRPSASLRRSPSGPLENGHAVGLAKPGYTGAPGSSVLQKVDPSLDATFKIQALTLSDEDSRADRGTGVSAPDEAFSPGSSEKVLRDANSPRHSDTGGSCSPEERGSSRKLRPMEHDQKQPTRRIEIKTAII